MHLPALIAIAVETHAAIVMAEWKAAVVVASIRLATLALAATRLTILARAPVEPHRLRQASQQQGSGRHEYETRCFTRLLPRTCGCQRCLQSVKSLQGNAL
jgi:hypothetical protein